LAFRVVSRLCVLWFVVYFVLRSLFALVVLIRRQEVPEHRSQRTRADHRDGVPRQYGHDPGNRVRDGRADEQRAEQVEDRREEHRVGCKIGVLPASRPFLLTATNFLALHTHQITEHTAGRTSTGS